MGKKVLMIVRNDFVNDSRIIREADTLGRRNYQVKVIALHNDGLKEVEFFDNFSVERIKLKTRGWSKNLFVQIFKYWEFFQKAVKKGIDFNPDIIHCHDYTPLPIGYKIKKKLDNRPVLIYDSHELWSHSYETVVSPTLFNWIQRRVEHHYIKKVDRVITVCDSISDFIKEQDGLKFKPTVVRNVTFKTEINKKNDILRKKLGLDKRDKIVLYQGVVSKGRGLEKVIESLPYFNESIVLVIIGDGPLKSYLKSRAEQLMVADKVYFLPFINHDQLIKYTNSADLGISPIQNLCLSYYYSLPNKIFEYIQAEIPIVCSNFPEMANVVKEYNLGEVFEPEDPQSIAEAVNNILGDTQKHDYYVQNTRQAKEKLNWGREEEKLVKLYNEL